MMHQFAVDVLRVRRRRVAWQADVQCLEGIRSRLPAGAVGTISRAVGFDDIIFVIAWKAKKD